MIDTVGVKTSSGVKEKPGSKTGSKTPLGVQVLKNNLVFKIITV